MLDLVVLYYYLNTFEKENYKKEQILIKNALKQFENEKNWCVFLVRQLKVIYYTYTIKPRPFFL